ncbi:GNAT family N-acetyltransferase [Flavobacterium sp. ACAM 123]|jgi:GNAT superfamily N-acetyltransferase|uniref:GNAT family N-acetyltransferase n=1 Tax=Flavobacterium sp. ACAM 123 TaxID=1189620 RepID=UPI0002F32719|nr:GNAT family N-acetyltransferase [Flavobacterium sp. ACAM 123]
MKIENSAVTDVDEIFRLYANASAYQKTKNVVVWPDFERQLVEKELNQNRQWKLLIDDQIACVWAITFNDPEIWEERDKDAAIYIHRIATNPKFRGHNFVATIVDWAKEYAQNIDKYYIRLDTLGNNVRLIDHYTSAGFDFLGIFELNSTAGLPQHYQTTKGCCLFEIKL